MLKFLTAKMNLNAQSSMEFFILIGLAFLAVIIFVAASAGEIKEFQDNKEFLLIRDLGLKLQKEAAIAAAVEEGYQRKFTLPDRLESTLDYFITTTNTTVTINSSRTVFSARIQPVIGNFTKGTNTIRKTGERVYINT